MERTKRRRNVKTRMVTVELIKSQHSMIQYNDKVLVPGHTSPNQIKLDP